MSFLVVIPDNYQKAFGLPTEETVISDLLKWSEENDQGAHWALEPDGSSRETVKWYDHEEEMLEFSKRWESIVFVLTGKGEEAGDLWVKYFRNGKKQVSNARIIYDPFDPNALN